ncbi:MAG: molybdopterin-guanine dinucleotide biosynthesis protein A [Paraglaciecola sp.]|jgi:molybdopterin-guanine dinucleotide biosynthesis protein A
MSFMGVVLAGGQSKRMGSDKALLTLNGENMLSRTVHCLQQANAKDVIISRNKPSEPGLRDIHANKGPLSGIHTAALNMPHLDLLLVPVDLPYLHYQELQQLCQYSQKHHCSSYFTEHNLPIYLRNNRATVEILEHILLHSDDYSVAGFIRQISAQAIRPLENQHLLNTNHPDQWQQAQQALQTNNHAAHKET